MISARVADLPSLQPVRHTFLESLVIEPVTTGIAIILLLLLLRFLLGLRDAVAFLVAILGVVSVLGTFVILVTSSFTLLGSWGWPLPAIWLAVLSFGVWFAFAASILVGLVFYALRTILLRIMAPAPASCRADSATDETDEPNGKENESLLDIMREWRSALSQRWEKEKRRAEYSEYLPHDASPRRKRIDAIQGMAVYLLFEIIVPGLFGIAVVVTMGFGAVMVVAEAGKTTAFLWGEIDEPAQDWFAVVNREDSTNQLENWAYCKYQLLITDDEADLLFKPLDFPLDKVWLIGALANFRYQDVYVANTSGEEVPVRLAYSGGDRYVLISPNGEMRLRHEELSDADAVRCELLSQSLGTEKSSFVPSNVQD